MVTSPKEGNMKYYVHGLQVSASIVNNRTQ
jgi:hypothetical protein